MGGIPGSKCIIPKEKESGGDFGPGDMGEKPQRREQYQSKEIDQDGRKDSKCASDVKARDADSFELFFFPEQKSADEVSAQPEENVDSNSYVAKQTRGFHRKPGAV